MEIVGRGPAEMKMDFSELTGPETDSTTTVWEVGDWDGGEYELDKGCGDDCGVVVCCITAINGISPVSRLVAGNCPVIT
jgi:hypothetical protein